MTDTAKLRGELDVLRAAGFASTANTIEAKVAAEVARLERENAELRAWGQQVHDALDGRPLPEHPDEAPARVAKLERELANARERLRLIQQNAESWHAGEDGKARALAVIASWARGDEIPAALASARGGER